MSEAGPRHRLKLWLRSEKAFGLRSVVASSTPFAEESSTDETESGDAIAHHGATPDIPTRSQVDSHRRPEPPAQGAAALFAAEAPGLAMPDASESPFDAPPLSSEEKKQRLIAMDDKEVRGCTKCRLCETRTNTVFGEGNHDAKIFFIGEGPGETEDRTGRPFVGRAGELLDKMIAAMGLKRGDVYIANIVKCRPPGNRVPAPDEVATCTPYLQRQLEIIRPQVIVTLGLPAAKYMLQTTSTMGRLRGAWQQWRGIKLMPTFHPAYVLRNQTYQTRAAVWSDLQQVMAEVGLTPPRKSGAGNAEEDDMTK
jgi:DNA polymerase